MFALAFLLATVPGGARIAWWAPFDPGLAHGSYQSGTAVLENQALRFVFSAAPKLQNKYDHRDLDLASGFPKLKLADGTILTVANFKVLSKARISKVSPDSKSTRKAGHLPGYAVNWVLVDAKHGLRVAARAVLRDGEHYVREEFTLRAIRADVDAREMEFVRTQSGVAPQVIGTAPGSPIVARNFFLGVEHPMALNAVTDGVASGAVGRKLPIRAGQTATYSTVIGVSPAGQMRRAFQAYIEAERARPYEPFLHYNSWYDVGYFTPYTEKDCVDRINTFGEELAVKRGVKLNSFLFDDGWDDTSTVWSFHKGFPNGFVPLKEAAAKFGAAPGIWLSPWGGYSTPRERRLVTGKKLGYEIDQQGYALSGPRYFERFRDVCLRLVKENGVNQFKFDGTGSPDKNYPGSAFDSDFDAAISLIDTLRQAQPKLFVNLTTGTWPSPFWLRIADSTWRGGSDHSFAGVGTSRQKWITYRDADTYRGVVQKGPFYPLNSLMLHGIIFAKDAHGLKTSSEEDFRDEVRDYFGNGTQLQEMYITPGLLNEKNWDDLAEAAKWSEANKRSLIDSHWVGGDPGKLEVYGWAGLSDSKAVLTLRNPNDRPQAFAVDVAKVLELPTPTKGALTFTAPWKDSVQGAKYTLPIGKSKVLVLAPFEVLNLQANLKATATTAKTSLNNLPVQIAPKAKRIIKRLAIVGASVDEGVLSAALGDSIQVRTFTGPMALSQTAAYAPDAVVVGASGSVRRDQWNEFVDQLSVVISTLRLGRSHPDVYVLSPTVPADAGADAFESVYLEPLVKQASRESGVPVIAAAPVTNWSASERVAYAIADSVIDRRVDKKGWKLVSTDSEEPEEGLAAAAIDGDPDTYWHTRYSPSVDKLPHSITVDMGSSRTLIGFGYLPRQDGGVNGRVKRYAFELSEDGSQWSRVSEGEFLDTPERSRVSFSKPLTGRFFRFVALSEANGAQYTTAAELDVYSPIGR